MEPALAPSTGEVSPQLPGSPSRKSGASRRGNEHPPAPPVSTIPDGVSDAPASGQDGSKKPAKRRKHRNRKRRNRRPSFLVTPPAPAESQDPEAGANGQQTSSEHPVSKPSLTPYKLGGNLSTTSLESDTLLDHRFVVFQFSRCFIYDVLQTANNTTCLDAPGITRQCPGEKAVLHSHSVQALLQQLSAQRIVIASLHQGIARRKKTKRQ